MLIDETGKTVGVVETRKAVEYAESKSLDLVCVAPQAQPPVCKVLNYSKFRYEKEKKEKEALKNQKVVDIKEIQLSPTIASHDFETKLNQGRKFLEHGDKVKITVRIKRRFASLTQQAMQFVMDYVNKCADIAVPETKKPDFDGKQIMFTIAPKPKKDQKSVKVEEPAKEEAKAPSEAVVPSSKE